MEVKSRGQYIRSRVMSRFKVKSQGKESRSRFKIKRQGQESWSRVKFMSRGQESRSRIKVKWHGQDLRSIVKANLLALPNRAGRVHKFFTNLALLVELV